MINFFKKTFNKILNFTNTQKIFLLILIFNVSSEGKWVFLFQNQEGTVWYGGSHLDNIFWGLNCLCIVGFLLFWKIKNNDR